MTDRPKGKVLTGHVLDRLAEMEPESVSCVVTSPPYWGPRFYPAPDVVWDGDAECEHEWGERLPDHHPGQVEQTKWKDAEAAGHGQTAGSGCLCARCGAWRGQYGLEPTPELYVEHTLDVLRGIRRVLRPDGVVWWNIGDGYAASPSGNQRWTGWATGGVKDASGNYEKRSTVGAGLKPKDLVLMPFRVALAAQADGWFVRSVVIWAKPNAMPESVTDRPTTSHEYVIMLTKSARYWYDADAVREAHKTADDSRNRPDYEPIPFGRIDDHNDGATRTSGPSTWPSAGRNLRSVWEFPTAQTPESHFATFPPELPRRCIEASCPREVCVRCGHARVRVVESKRGFVDGTCNGCGAPRNKHIISQKRTTEGGLGNSATMLEDGAVPCGNDTTIGWTSCDCAEPEYQPGLVLDPFCGTGTTLYVAKQLGRRAVGIELSEKYAKMARKNIAGQGELLSVGERPKRTRQRPWVDRMTYTNLFDAVPDGE